MGEPNDRQIIWAWSEEGNVGKSRFAKYLCYWHGAAVCQGKAADIKHMYMTMDKPIYIADVPRTYQDSMRGVYQAFEEIKNGLVFSGKYESTMTLRSSPHLIVFANFPPPAGDEVWSADRVLEIRATRG